MADQQRSLSGYKSKVAEPGEFENPNEGKTPLTEFDEYILKLNVFPHVKTFKQAKTNKDGTTSIEEIEKAIVEFSEKNTGNIVMSFLRVDKLNFSDDESYRSAVIRFFHKIGHPLIEGVEPDWDKYFIVGMRFRARVVVGTDVKDVGGRKVKTPNGKYYVDIPTCRPLLPSDKEGEDFEKPATQPAAETPAASRPAPDEAAALLANALLIAKGAKNRGEAFQKLADAKASKEVTMALFDADLTEKVKYPI